jgi:hypothetical protein
MTRLCRRRRGNRRWVTVTDLFSPKTRQNPSIFAFTSWSLSHTVTSHRTNCYVSKTLSSVHSLRVSCHNSPHRSLKDIPLKTAFARQSAIANDKAGRDGTLPRYQLIPSQKRTQDLTDMAGNPATYKPKEVFEVRRELGAVQACSFTHPPIDSPSTYLYQTQTS